MTIQMPRGTRDVLPGESYLWHFVEGVIRDVTAKAGYREVRTPTFEHTELFRRGVGDTTDVVQKEMYTFDDKGGRSITLKPESTASVVRAYIEHGLSSEPSPMKMYYIYSPHFRYEAPQAGRYREHHQFGVEVFGAASPMTDAEVIMLAGDVLAGVGIRGGVKLHINSIGCPACRQRYRKQLQGFLRPRLDALCALCKDRFERNPMRILDCKNEHCREMANGAPVMLDCLCGDCAAHFEGVKAHLDAIGQEYIVDPLIVRGLDYYTRTVFEYIPTVEGLEGVTAAAGGRYDGLVETIGGTSTPGAGFGMGMERIVLLMERLGVAPPSPPLLDIILITLGDRARAEAFGLIRRLREAGFKADCDHMGRSIKAQFKYADKTGARLALILGDGELDAGAVKLRDMKTGEETNVPMGGLMDTLKQ